MPVVREWTELARVVLLKGASNEALDEWYAAGITNAASNR